MKESTSQETLTGVVPFLEYTTHAYHNELTTCCGRDQLVWRMYKQQSGVIR